MAKPDHATILAEARKRLKIAIDADADNRKAALDDLRFAWDAAYQWDDAAKKARDNRPCLTENRLPQFIRQIVNGMRANRPSLHVSPVRNGTMPAAKIMEGVIRHIEQYSKADLAIDSAAEYAVAGGFGYFRIATEYVDDESFDQDIVYRPIENPFSVYDDPHYQMPDASDRQWCFVTEWVDRDEFEAEYGFQPANIGDSGLGDQEPIWLDEKRVLRAEYWRVVTERADITEPVPVPAVQGVPALADQPKPRTRTVERKRVEQYLLTGDRILKSSEWSGRLIPIIPVFGETITIDGKKYRKSLIRDAKDPQRMNNYFLSAETEAVALQPKAPFIGWTGQFETDRKKWANANSANHAYLQADAVPDVPGAGLPQRQPPPQFPQALRESRLASIEAIKASMGVYDASLGARTNEVSGIAIQQRQAQGDLSTFHFPDNMARALRYAGLVIIDLIPHIYDQERVVRMVNADGTADMAAINSVVMDPNTFELGKTPDVRVGTYDVVVKAGPSFQTQRQETAEMMVQLMKADPRLGQIAGDILVKNLDFPGADEVAQRIQQAMQGAGVPPEVQQQIQGMQQTLATGAQAFQDLQQKSRMQELQLAQKDLEIKQRDIALKDKAVSASIDHAEAITHRQEVVLDAILKFIDLQQKQLQPVVAEAQQLKPGVETLVQ